MPKVFKPQASSRSRVFKISLALAIVLIGIGLYLASTITERQTSESAAYPPRPNAGQALLVKAYGMLGRPTLPGRIQYELWGAEEQDSGLMLQSDFVHYHDINDKLKVTPVISDADLTWLASLLTKKSTDPEIVAAHVLAVLDAVRTPTRRQGATIRSIAAKHLNDRMLFNVKVSKALLARTQ
jgi:hypothetical protein